MILNNNNNKFKQQRELEFSFPLSLKHRRNFSSLFMWLGPNHGFKP